MKSDFLKALSERGFIHQCTNLEGLDELALKGPITAYVGFDATADSLHVGNLVSLMMLRRLAKNGGIPIALLGTGTTRIGDPSDKTSSRPMLTDEQIRKNAEGIISSIERVLTDGPVKTDTPLIVENGDWLNGLNHLDFLREVGPHFTINRMTTMDFVRNRLENELPLTFLEFSYILLQSFDFAELYKRHGVVLQMGGSDQWGNIVNGIDLGRRLHGAELFGLTTPLITTSSGDKMGKTASGAVWLNTDKTSPYEYFQFWRNTEDADVFRFLKLFTDMDIAGIESIENLVANHKFNINIAKEGLAFEATMIMHGAVEAKSAYDASKAAFGGEGGSTEGLPSMAFCAGLKVSEAVIGFGFANTRSEVRRLCEQGGVKINDAPVSDHDTEILVVQLPVKLSVGKKRHGIIK